MNERDPKRRRLSTAVVSAVVSAALLLSGCSVPIGSRDKLDGRDTRESVSNSRLQASIRLEGTSRAVLSVDEVQDVEIQTFQLFRKIEIRVYRRGPIIALVAVGIPLFFVVLILVLASTADTTDTEPVE